MIKKIFSMERNKEKPLEIVLFLLGLYIYNTDKRTKYESLKN